MAQENGDCFTCHADKDLSKKRDGKTVSLFVDEKHFGGGAHAKVPCIGCHADLKGTDFPHAETLKEAGKLGACHVKEAANHAAGLPRTCGGSRGRGGPPSARTATAEGTTSCRSRTRDRR